MSAEQVTDLQGWIIIFAIIGGIITVGTAGWRIINFLRTETKDAIKEEHEFNIGQHQETRKVVKDALQNIDDKFRDVKTEVARISDIRVDVAVHKERLAKHEDAINYLNRETKKYSDNG